MTQPTDSASPFANIRGSSIALLPFLPAGYPTMEATLASIRAIDQVAATHRIGAIEIGFPFSDPIADGPRIQEAFNVALNAGITAQKIFDAIATLGLTKTPMVAMVSYSIVFRFGVDRFLSEAKRAGFSGILIPDLPPPEAQEVCERVKQAGLDTVLLVAPTTPLTRRKLIAELCSGFVYYLAVSGVTGDRKDLPPDIAANLAEIQAASPVPVCVGFGVSKLEHMKQLQGKADGAIVGTAVVRVMREHFGETSDVIAQRVAAFCRELV